MRAALLALSVFAASALVLAQSGSTFRARLSPVPIDLTMQSTIAGTGLVTASLAGTKLTVTGTFDGLKSPATVAAIHRSPVRGVRGPEVAALTVSPAASGAISGSVELTAAQVADLHSGRLYVQVHSETAPDGNLWGWLLEKH